MNTGSIIFPSATPRGAESFMAIADFPFTQRKKSLQDNVVELCVIDGIDDVEPHVVRVDRRKGSQVLGILHEV